MKLKINKASDLSSISVLPPQSRKVSNSATGGLDSSSIYGRSQTVASQLRSQQQASQMSFSQGISSQHGLFSQFSQNSQEETLTAEKLGSQERENSAKRGSGLPPTGYAREENQVALSRNGYAREENQVALSRNSGNIIRKWSGPEQKRQTSEELEHRMGMVETSLNRLGMIMDSVQSDIMQVNKGTKEVALEMNGTQQKLVAHDRALQLLNKGQEDIKNRLDMSLKTLSDQIKQNMNQDNLQEISSMLSCLPEKLECQMVKLHTDLSKKLHTELSKDFNQKIQDLTCSLQILKQKPATPSLNISKAVSFCVPTQQVQIQNKPTSCLVPSQQVQVPNKPASCFVPNQQVRIPNKATSCIVPTQQVYVRNTFKRQAKKESLEPKVEVGGWKSVKQERATTRAGNLSTRNNPIKVSPGPLITRRTIVIESDEEIDDGFSCLLKEKGSEVDGYLIEESNKETARILRKARLRKRKHSKIIVIN